MIALGSLEKRGNMYALSSDGRWPALHKGWTGIEREAYYNDIPQIISAGGNQFLATRGGESQQNIFKSHRRRALERGHTWEEPSHLSMGTPHCHSRRHVPDSRSRSAPAP